MPFDVTEDWVPRKGDTWVDTWSQQEWVMSSDPFPTEGTIYAIGPNGREKFWNLGVFKHGRLGLKVRP